MAASGSSTAEGGGIIVVGSCNVDLCTYTPRFPRPGETLIGSEFEQGCGGKGSNQAVMASMLCEKGVVGMVGCVGDDAQGRSFRDAMTEAGVDVSLLSTAPPGVSTGTAAILIDATGENCIVVAPGANKHVTEPVVRASAVSSRIATARVVVTQNEIPPEATSAAVEIAAAAARSSASGLPVTLSNPAPAPDRLSKQLCRDIDVLVLNETEAQALAPSSARISHYEAALLTIAVVLRPAVQGRGRVLVVTRGSHGPVVVYVPPQGEGDARVLWSESFRAERVVDTVGAGDAFVGSLAAVLHRCEDGAAVLSDPDRVLEAVRRAGAVATMSVEGKGTQSSYPSRDRVVGRFPFFDKPL